jgi:hypothetical protein
MNIAIGLALLVATSDVSGTVEALPASPAKTADAAALGATLGAGLSGVAMFGALFVVCQTPEGVDALLDARQSAGAVPFVAAVALVSVASSAIGAGAGYALADGDPLDAPAAMGGAMLGATVASAVGAVPAAFAFAAADATLAQPVNGVGDAIGTGVAAGFSESFGYLASMGASLFLAPPAAAAGAYHVADALAVNALDEDSVSAE